jgi:hypothetical protein
MKVRFSVATAMFCVLSRCLLAQAGQPQTYGTTATSYVRLSALEFSLAFSSLSYQEGSGTFGRYVPGCGGACLLAQLNLPSGAQIVSIELDAIDTDAFDYVYTSLYQCDKFLNGCSQHPTAGAGPADCLQAGYICSGKSFSGGAVAQAADLSSDNLIADNTSTTYFLGVGADEAAEVFSGVIVGYVLQVSPPPGTSDFNDVSTSSTQFKFIEALYHAGITAGCGGGNFCPDSPLTRGQMAVFLAKALGLQWP